MLVTGKHKFVSNVPNDGIATRAQPSNWNDDHAFTSRVRADIPTQIVTQNTFMLAGFATEGDLGAGAIYTSVGAGPSGPMAIQDSTGKWFNLVIQEAVKVGWFGAKGDGVTDDTAAIQAAINAKSNRRVLLTPSSGQGVPYIVSSTLQLPIGTILEGTGVDYCILQAKSPFTGTSVVRYGVAGVQTNNCKLRNLQVDANNIANLSCVDLNSGQEGTEVSGCILQRFTIYGITHFANGSLQNIRLLDNWIWASANGATAGISLSGVAGLEIMRHTIVSLKQVAPANCADGINITGCSGIVAACHFEGVTNGVTLGDNNAVNFSGLDGLGGFFPLANIVNYANGIAPKSTFTGILKGAATNTYAIAFGALTGSDYIINLDATNLSIATVTLTVGASPFNYSNATGRAQIVYITGGTVSSVVTDRPWAGGTVTLPGTTNMVILPPASRVIVTYTVAPTMLVMPL